MKKLLPALVGAVLIWTLGGCSFMERGPQSSPERLMEAYLGAFQEHDLDTMFSLTVEAEESEDELAHLRSFIQMIDLEAYTIEQVDYISENEAVVKISLNLRLMDHVKTQTDSVKVVCNEGLWFLQEGLIDP